MMVHIVCILLKWLNQYGSIKIVVDSLYVSMSGTLENVVREMHNVYDQTSCYNVRGM